jgi:hypothetical protein
LARRYFAEQDRILARSKFINTDFSQLAEQEVHSDIISDTRYARYHAAHISDRALIENEPGFVLSELIALRPQYRLGGEVVLDGSDNLLLSKRSQHEARTERWPMLMRRYIDSIWTFLDTKIDEAIPRRYCGLDVSRELNLQEVETYWEFRHH